MRLSGQALVLGATFVLGGCGFGVHTTLQTGAGTGGAGEGAGTGGRGGGSSGGVPGSAGAQPTGFGGDGVASGGSGGGGDIVFGRDAAPPGCGQTNVSVMPQPPDILIVQDRSLSMTDDSNDQPCAGGTAQGDGNCGANSKWAQVTTALSEVVAQTQSTVNWGLMYLGDEATVCGAATAPVVDVGPGASPLIDAAFAGVQFTGQIGTPTTAVLNNAVQYLQSGSDTNQKFLLLATDGEPNCARGSAAANDDVGAEDAVAAAKTAGFPTFVVGIATSSDAAATNALNAMAVNGGEAQTGAATQYYAVTDTSDLVTVLQEIVALTVPCTIPLTGVNGTLDNVAVSAKDASGKTIEIMPDASNGWSYTDATKTAIVLNGDACTSLQSLTFTDFQFIYTCSTGTICIDDCPAPP